MSGETGGTEHNRAHLDTPGLRRANIQFPFNYEPPITLSGVTAFPDVAIGRHSYMTSGIIRSRTTVGRYCSIGRDVLLGAPHHSTHRLTTHPVSLKSKLGEMPEPRPRRAETVVGHDVWIGDKVTVIGGVAVGTGAIIGASAVVTKDVPPYAVVGGVPAKIIRYRFDEATCAALLRSEWWTLKYDSLLSLDMNDVAGCLAQIDELRRRDGSDEESFVTLT